MIGTRPFTPALPKSKTRFIYAVVTGSCKSLYNTKSAFQKLGWVAILKVGGSHNCWCPCTSCFNFSSPMRDRVNVCGVGLYPLWYLCRHLGQYHMGVCVRVQGSVVFTDSVHGAIMTLSLALEPFCPPLLHSYPCSSVSDTQEYRVDQVYCSLAKSFRQDQDPRASLSLFLGFLLFPL